MRAEHEYEPEREVEEDADAEEVVSELAEDRTDEEEVEEEVEQAPDERALEMVRRAAVVEVVRDVLAQRDVDVAGLVSLSDHEREALGFLQVIVDGRTKGGDYLYAEERLEQLNLVLADLQPLLSVGQIEGLDGALAEVIDGIDELRRRLDMLSEADDEILEALFYGEDQGAADDDKDDDDQGDQGDQGDRGDKDDGAPEAQAATPEAATPEAGTTSEPNIKQEKLWRRIFKRGKKPDAPGASDAPAAPDAPDAGGDQPRKSTVWDPDDKGDA